MRHLSLIVVAIALAGQLVSACAQKAETPKRRATTEYQSLCTSSGGYWNTSMNNCTCSTGYTYDYTSRRCLAGGLNGQLGGYPGTYPSTTSGQCGVGMIMMNGSCVALSSVTEQQGCQSTGGTWSGSTCSCPAGMTYQAAWKSCQGFGAGTSAAQQLCVGSGGTSDASGQCVCANGMSVQVHPATGYQYCAAANSGMDQYMRNQRTLAITQLVLTILQNAGRIQ